MPVRRCQAGNIPSTSLRRLVSLTETYPRLVQNNVWQIKHNFQAETWLRGISQLWKIKWLKSCEKYQQIKARAVAWWKLKLSVVDEPMEEAESETLARKRTRAKRYFIKGYKIFLEGRLFFLFFFSEAQEKTNCEISFIRKNNVNKQLHQIIKWIAGFILKETWAIPANVPHWHADKSVLLSVYFCRGSTVLSRVSHRRTFVYFLWWT